MHRRALICTSLGALACAALPMTARAHRQKLSVSEVTWDPDTNSLGITHRVHLHDAEKALTLLGKTQTPGLRTLREQAKFAIYVNEVFGLTTSKGADVQPVILGAEIEGHYIYVYQEAKMKAKPEGLVVNCKILRDVFPDQRNHVNVSLSGEVQTLKYAGKDGAKSTS